ncbi:5-deoxy-glucuronate isomerase [Oceanicola sp. S124]|uniref:5-deoxy-glucuronate isomerase n=1 Tax=Oceanicola sp. S124 TaxID=1042378 RepID=UPI0002558D36|nr:5-deoxy-glucuronate isomerase [Oceanicola sp. S124]
MADLQLKPQRDSGCITRVTPESAGWGHVGFEVHRLAAGETLEGAASDRETCLVWVSGRGQAQAVGHDFGELGERMSPFDGPPHALYVPAGADWAVTATTALELAVCSAPGGGDFAARAIPPGTHPVERRGTGSNLRHVHNIMPEDDGAAQSLLVVEVITPGGNTSSYPPHKHDRDALPGESQLEETYYHRLNPPQGYAFQRVYTDDLSLDETMCLSDGDVVLVPRGYHPCATLHGYDLYYLNVMAGPRRVWRFHNQEDHAWLLKT